METELRPTPASAFKESATKLVTLPTNRVVQIQRLNLFALLEQGLLPMLEKLEDLRVKAQGKSNIELVKALGADKELRGFIEALLIAGVVKPRLTLKPLAEIAMDSDEVPLQILTNEEIAALMNEISTYASMGATVPFLPPKPPEQNSSSSTESPPAMDSGPAS